MEKEQLKKYLHFVMALTGGFLGAYTLLNHHDLFGNAQTSNMIYIAMDLVGHNIGDFLLRIMDLAVYAFGFACTVLIPKYTKLNLQVCSIIINVIAGMIICLIPSSVNDFAALCPVLFATSFQWNSFKGAEGFVSSTIFSTNNLRQFTTSFTEFLCDKDHEHLRKTKFYGGVLLSYHFGVAVSFILYLYLGTKGGWFCIFPSLAALTLLAIQNDWIGLPKWKTENV